MFDLKTKLCKSLWPIFHGPLILPYTLKTIWWMNIILWDYESVWPNIWPQSACRSLWPIFHGPLILLYILKTVWCWTSLFRITSWYDLAFDLIFSDNKTVWPKLWPQNKYRSTCLYLSVTQRLTSSSICRSVTYILWSSDFASYLEDYLMEKSCIWDNGSVWHKDQPRKIDLVCESVACISLVHWFCLISCHTLELFLYFKNCCRPGVFVPIWALALVHI